MTIAKESSKFSVIGGIIYYNSIPLELYLGYDYKEVLTPDSLQNLLELMNLTPEFLRNSDNGKFGLKELEGGFQLVSKEGDSMQFLQELPQYSKPNLDLDKFIELLTWYNTLFRNIEVFEYAKVYLTEERIPRELKLTEEVLESFRVQSDSGPEVFLTADRQEFITADRKVEVNQVIDEIEFWSKTQDSSEPYLTSQGEKIVNYVIREEETDTTVYEHPNLVLTESTASIYKRCYITQELNNTVIDCNNWYFSEGVKAVDEIEYKYPITENCLVELLFDSGKVVYTDLFDGVDIYTGVSIKNKVISTQEIVKRINIYYETDNALHS